MILRTSGFAACMAGGHAARYRRPPPRRRERPERRNYIARLSYYLSMVLTAGLNMVGRQAVEVAAIHLFVQPLKITGEAEAIE